MSGKPYDYDGYTEQELCVSPKYKLYKEEILSHLDMKKYLEVTTKAKAYFVTERVKALKPTLWGFLFAGYGLSSSEDPVTLDHIISLVLYCDYSAYCSEFSSTFRKISITESMEDVKLRNSHFWHQSKNLREIVEVWGTCNRPGYLQDGIDAESGPFYTGIDIVLAVPEFSIRLCAPTSTTKHVEVSLNFAKKGGMVIQLNNPEKDMRSNCASLFDVSWISRFPDEDERLFIGMII